MCRLVSIHAAMSVVVPITAIWVVLEQLPNRVDDLADRTRAFNASPLEARRVCGMLFNNGRLEEIFSASLTDVDTGLALQAAWRLHGQELVAEPPHFGVLPRRHCRNGIQRFLGTVEGHARILVPEWWEFALEMPDLCHPSRTRLHKADWVRFADKDNASAVRLQALVEGGLSSVKKGVRLETVAAVEDITVEDILTSPHLEFCTLTVGASVLFVLRERDSHELWLLYCESENKEISWHSRLWGKGPAEGATGRPGTSVEVIDADIADGSLVIFGCHSVMRVAENEVLRFYDAVFYLEKFRLTDGTPQMRFATNEWGGFGEE